MYIHSLTFLKVMGGLRELFKIDKGMRKWCHVYLVLRECIWNAPAVSLVLTTFDDTGSLGSPPRQVVYPPGSMVPPWVTASRFLVFLSFLFS